jgi:hypothetical protein
MTMWRDLNMDIFVLHQVKEIILIIINNKFFCHIGYL